MEHSLYLKNRTLYVLVSILLVLAIMISMITPAHALAGTAVLVSGAVIIASIFTAFGLITTANNSETVKGLVNQCLADGITAGIFDADGNLLTRTIGTVTMVLTSVIQWVKSWFNDNTTIQNGGSVTYYTASQLYDKGVRSIKLKGFSQAERVAFMAACGMDANSILNCAGQDYFLYSSGAGNVSAYNLNASYARISSVSGSYAKLDLNSKSWWQYRISNQNWSSTGQSGNTNVIWFEHWYRVMDQPTIIAIDLASNHAGSLPLSTTFPTWTAEETDIPTTLDDDGVTAPALPMTIPDTVDDALSMTQTEAQGATDLGYESSVDPGDGEGPIVPWFSNIFGGIWQYAESVIDYCIEAARAFVVCLSAFLPTRVQDYMWLCAAIVIIFGTFKLFIR